MQTPIIFQCGAGRSDIDVLQGLVSPAWPVNFLQDLANQIYWSMPYKKACRMNGITPARFLSVAFGEHLSGPWPAFVVALCQLALTRQFLLYSRLAFGMDLSRCWGSYCRSFPRSLSRRGHCGKLVCLQCILMCLHSLQAYGVYRVASMFSGVGGLELGLRESSTYLNLEATSVGGVKCFRTPRLMEAACYVAFLRKPVCFSQGFNCHGSSCPGRGQWLLPPCLGRPDGRGPHWDGAHL